MAVLPFLLNRGTNNDLSNYRTGAVQDGITNQRVLEGDFMRSQRDALFFGRGAPGSHVVWSNPEHSTIGTNDFTLCIPVLDWYYSTSGNNAGVTAIVETGQAGYGGATTSLSLAFTSTGQLALRLHDPTPNQDTNVRSYVLPKASVYDVAANRPGLLIVRRIAGAMSMRLNTQVIALPPETVTGSPVSTWASALQGTIILGQVWSQAGYLGKLGVPLVYSCGLSDAECDILVTQGHRALPYRRGSFKNFMPTGIGSWGNAGGGYTLSQYDLAADPDGVGLPAGVSPSAYCLKVVRSGASGGTALFASGLFANVGPVWRAGAHIKVTALASGTLSWGSANGNLVAMVGANGQINSTGISVPVSVADGWKYCETTVQYVGDASGGTGPSLNGNASVTDYTAYIVAPRASPLGLLFDGVVQPIPIIADVGPNRVFGRLVNRVDPITDKFLSTFVASTNTSGNQQLCGGPCVNVNHDLEVWARSLSGTPTINVGNVSGGSQIASAQALTTTWRKLTLVGGSHLTSTQNIWVNSNSNDVVELRVKTRAL